jgi:hypothetical protein
MIVPIPITALNTSSANLNSGVIPQPLLAIFPIHATVATIFTTIHFRRLRACLTLPTFLDHLCRRALLGQPSHNRISMYSRCSQKIDGVP